LENKSGAFDDGIEPVDAEPMHISDLHELDIGEINDQLNPRTEKEHQSTKEASGNELIIVVESYLLLLE
jgi:hypothetical protein